MTTQTWIEDNLICSVGLKINQDWNPVIERSLNLIKISKTKQSSVEPYGNATFYHLGNLGSVVHHHISQNWHLTVGPWVYKFLPWLEKMLFDM